MTHSAPDLSAVFSLLKKTEQSSLTWSVDNVFPLSEPQSVMFLNAHGVNLAHKNQTFCDVLNASEYVLRDGIGVEMGFQRLGFHETPNLNGTDLIPVILNHYKDKRVAVWGSSDEALSQLKERLDQEGYRLVSMEHGFHEDEFYLQRYQDCLPDIVVLCMGMPRQELLTSKLKQLDHASLIICGGGWANFYSGFKKRAPGWVRKLKLEWMHRLCSEPLRLGKRYTIDILYYFMVIFKVARQRKAP